MFPLWREGVGGQGEITAWQDRKALRRGGGRGGSSLGEWGLFLGWVFLFRHRNSTV